MKVVYSPQRDDRQIEYDIQGNLIHVTIDGDHYNTYDVSGDIEEADFMPVRKQDDQIILLRFYGLDEKHLFEK